MHVVIEIVTDILCGISNSIGGYSQHNFRRFIMPILLALSVFFITNIWWCGLLVLPVIGTLCLKYFSDKNWGRALWVFLQAVVIGLGLTITGHVSWVIYIPYIIGAGILGGIYKNWWQPLGDFIVGLYIGLIVFFVR